MSFQKIKRGPKGKWIIPKGFKQGNVFHSPNLWNPWGLSISLPKRMSRKEGSQDCNNLCKPFNFSKDPPKDPMQSEKMPPHQALPKPKDVSWALNAKHQAIHILYSYIAQKAKSKPGANLAWHWDLKCTKVGPNLKSLLMWHFFSPLKPCKS